MNSISKPDLLIRRAYPDDLPKISNLFVSLKLPTEGLTEHMNHFLVAESGGGTIGSIGLEVYGSTALLRSAAVAPSHQGKGVGEKMYSALISYARELGVEELVLLTTTAEGYFHRHGFSTIERESVVGAVTLSREFTDACPATATVMRKRL